jgi:hypothetical protein
MVLSTKTSILKDGVEQNIAINDVCEFTTLDNTTETIRGRVIDITGTSISFDCSSQYNYNIKVFQFARLNSLQKVV